MVHMHMKARGQSQTVLLSCPPLNFLRHGLSLNLELADWLVSKLQGFPYLDLHSAKIIGIHHQVLGILTQVIVLVWPLLY